MISSLAVSRWATLIRLPFSICFLACCIQLVSITSSAQYTKLLDFAGVSNGEYPFGPLFSDGTFLYGMTQNGGTNNLGTIFKIKPDGSGYLRLLSFNGAGNGRTPYGTLISDGTFLYGMTAGGGTSDFGVVFKIMPDGTGYVRLLSFTGTANGSSPEGDLIYDGTFLYGATRAGGLNGDGTIFKIKPDGTGYVKLFDFSNTASGREPFSLVSDGTFLYGMTFGGGANSLGVVYKIKLDGTYTKLLDFAGAANGSNPYNSLVTDGTFLYGMTTYGGTSDLGIVFKIKPDGTGYLKLLDFVGATNGRRPYGSLFFDGTLLYGMATQGGSSNLGLIFKIMPDGTGYTKLYDFTGTANGGNPWYGSLISDGAFLYGMTNVGGANDMGTVFKYSLPPSVPTITSFTPISGPIGTTVTITGTNFSSTPSNNTVMFNGTVATVTASTATSITTTVPTGATTGTITVTIGGNTATSATNFTVTATPIIVINPQPINTATCAGQSATLSSGATGTTSIIYQWQVDNSGFINLANDATYSGVASQSLTIANPTNALNGKIYRCLIKGDLAADVTTNSVTLTVNSIPGNPTVLPLNLGCAPSSGTINPSGALSGESYRFYNAASGGSTVGSGPSFTTPIITVPTTYYVSTFNTTTFCESARVAVLANVQTCNPPVVMPTTSTAFIEGIITIDLEPLISDSDGNLDLTTLQVISQPISGAMATINGFELTIDYAGIPYPGTDELEIEVCDLTDICTQQQITVELAGDITIYNAISPNNDNINDAFIIRHINILPDAQKNKVTIFNRWGDVVFEISNYNNADRAFTGLNKNGKELPSGTYFYKIEFSSSRQTITGFLSLKR